MRILQISTSDRAGGAEKVALDLHRAYQCVGHDAELCVGKQRTEVAGVHELPGDELRNPLARLCCSARSSFADRGQHRLARLAGWGARLAEPRRFVDTASGREDFWFPGTRYLAERAGQYDVIHLHNLHGDYFDLRILPRLTRQAPVFLTLHDEWTYTGHCAYTFDCDRWQSHCGQCPRLHTYPAIRRDASDRNLDAKLQIYEQSRLRVAAPSRWLLERAQSSVLAPAIVESRLIPYGLDTNVFHPGSRASARDSLQLEQDRPVAVFIGNRARTNEFKDLGTILETVQHLGAGHRTENLLVICLGDDGETQTFGGVEIRYAGYIREQQSVALYLQAADLFLHAAHVDNSPCAVSEAMACGCCVVASSVGGIPEQFEHGVSGLLVPPADAQATAATLEALLQNHDRRERIAQQAAATARDRFDIARQTQAWLDWYREVCEDRDRSSSERLQPEESERALS